MTVSGDSTVSFQNCGFSSVPSGTCVIQVRETCKHVIITVTGWISSHIIRYTNSHTYVQLSHSGWFLSVQYCRDACPLTPPIVSPQSSQQRLDCYQGITTRLVNEAKRTRTHRQPLDIMPKVGVVRATSFAGSTVIQLPNI